MIRRAIISVLVVAALVAPAALADGDPASDFLIGQQSFVSPYDGHISRAEQDRLNAMLASAKAQGFTLKVAVIRTRYDLGAVTILYNKPQTYAKFLAQEDFFVWKDELLVVMPNGYGIYKAKGTPAADKAAIARLPRVNTTNGDELVQAAERAVTALARRRGIELSTSPVSTGGTSVWVERSEIAGGLAAVLVLTVAGRWLWRRRRA
jgi:hypothetical protein